MENLSTPITDPNAVAAILPDEMSLRKWFAFFVFFLVGTSVPLTVMISRQQWTWSDWAHNTAVTFAQTPVEIKLLGLGLYVSLCCTLLPMPTGWIIAGVATRAAAVAPQSLALTVLLVAVVGAVGSTMANLNDYHLFTLMLRHHRIAKLRLTRTYQAAAKWFARGPFLILVIFNIVPIPVDVVRLLATTYRYPRVPFAAANFVGRFIRYAVIAFVTYWWNLGWVAVVALLGLAIVLGLIRVLPRLVRHLGRGAVAGMVVLAVVGSAHSQTTRPASGSPGVPATRKAPATTTSAPAVAPAVMKILEQLEAAGKKHSTIRADLDYVLVMPELGDREERRGYVAFKTRTKKAPAKVRIHYKDLRQGRGRRIVARVDYAFDGRWLVINKYNIRQQERIQMVAEGQEPKSMRLEEGPIPLPFGQKAEEVLKYFIPTTRPTTAKEPKNTDYLKLDTRRHCRKELSVRWMEMWIDRKTHLPVKIISKDKSRYITTIVFRNIKTGLDIPDNEFLLPKRRGWTSTIRRFEKGENLRP